MYFCFVSSFRRFVESEKLDSSGDRQRPRRVVDNDDGHAVTRGFSVSSFFFFFFISSRDFFFRVCFIPLRTTS